jgi:hypothetical protein
MASALSKALAFGRPARLRLQGKEMIVSHIKRIALAYCVATAMLAGCNDRQISAIPAAASFSQQKVSRSGHQDLVYVSYSCGTCGGAVGVYTFPGGQLVGTWVGTGQSFASGQCADGAGNVFVTYSFYNAFAGWAGELLKFEHGGTAPVATLSDAEAPPVACSVDPTSGNLAVVNGGYAGTLLIYGNASGSPTVYDYPGVNFYGVTYDDKGNIFVDGMTKGAPPAFAFAELLKGKRSLEAITLDKRFLSAGELQWDGKHVTLGSGWIYRLDIHGSSGRVAGVTRLNHMHHDYTVAYWAAKKQIVVAWARKQGACPSYCGPTSGSVGVWSYPTGRAITKSVTPMLVGPTGVALSLAQNR